MLTVPTQPEQIYKYYQQHFMLGEVGEQVPYLMLLEGSNKLSNRIRCQKTPFFLAQRERGPKEFCFLFPNGELRIQLHLKERGLVSGWLINCLGCCRGYYNTEGLVVVVGQPREYWFLAESSIVNCSQYSCHLRTLLEKRKWCGSLEMKGVLELANTGQSGSKQSKQRLVCFLKQRGYIG